MGIIESGGRARVEVHLRRHAQARRMSLRVSALDGRVTLTLPRRTTLRAARAFLDVQEDWLAAAVEGVAAPVEVRAGVSIPLEGRDTPLAAAPLRAVRAEGGRLLVPAERTGLRVETYLKALARDRLVRACDELSAQIGTGFRGISLRDTRSRWGSCSSRGNLMFSWRLILAPPEVLRYVAAHEVAHLRHLDHSSAFWTLTEHLCPGHAAPRRWLRQHGAGLHRYRFGKD